MAVSFYYFLSLLTLYVMRESGATRMNAVIELSGIGQKCRFRLRLLRSRFMIIIYREIRFYLKSLKLLGLQ